MLCVEERAQEDCSVANRFVYLPGQCKLPECYDKMYCEDKVAEYCGRDVDRYCRNGGW